MKYYEIEKNIEIPKPRAYRRPKYPFKYMRPGDSFFVPFLGEDRIKLRGRIVSSAQYYGKKHDVKFVTRTTKEGIRVWLVDEHTEIKDPVDIRQSKYRFNTLATVGDSLLVNIGPGNKAGKQKLYVAASKYASRNNIKLKTKRDGDKIRVTRTA